MEHLDEHEMLIQYSEMSGFDFNSEEFQKVRQDYLETKNFISKIGWSLSRIFPKVRSVYDN